MGLGAALFGLGAIPGCTAPKLRVKMGIQGGTQTLWRYVAQKRDVLLKPLGYEVAFTNLPTEDALSKAFLEGGLDVIATLPPLVPSLAEGGLEVQFFLPIAWVREGYPLIVAADSSFQSLRDLIGRRVATFPLSHPGLAYWRAFVLENYGFRMEERLSLVEATAPEDLLRGGQVEAAVIASPAWSEMRLEGKYRLISDLATEWRKISASPDLLMYGGYIARRDWIQENRGFIDDFVRLNFETLKRYKENRSAVLEAATAYAGETVPVLSKEVNQAIASYLGYDDVPAERMYISQQDVEDYRKVYALLARCGYLKAAPSSVTDLFYIGQSKRPWGLLDLLSWWACH